MTIQLNRSLASLALGASLIAACGEADDPCDESGLLEDRGVERSELHKGTPGATVGDSNYCDDPAHPCALGEGDCDSSAGCEPGLICGRSKAVQFGLAAGDGCVPPHCVNRVRDADETQIDCGGTCGTSCAPPFCRSDGAPDRCNSDCPCGIGEGDCDSNEQCQAPLVCGRNKLAQFGKAKGDACVPAHCLNNRQDSGETSIDCGGECGDIECPHKGCVDPYATYVITINGVSHELDPVSPYDWGVCSATSGKYQRTLVATIVNGALEVEGWGFAGSYPIVEATSTGFTAQVSDFFPFSSPCGDAELFFNPSGLITFSAKCSTESIVFEAECSSDFTADGCYPNYTETARGAGTRSHQCAPGYRLVGGTCVDIDECADGTPCAGAATCTNVEGSFACSCDAPAVSCSRRCADLSDDPENCGECGLTCPSNASCADGNCVCNDGFENMAGACIDVDECATGQSGCSPNATCTNTVGGFECKCNAGYTGGGSFCTDIDECASKPCAGDEVCLNTPGSYECTCPVEAAICDGVCVTLSTSEANCGACGVTCAPQQVCRGGQCQGRCDAATGGPLMKELPGGYCIDTTEVTRSQYAAWLASAPNPADQNARACGWNASFVPACNWPPATNGNLPVSCVDWCDAFAYCKGVGKRLCGAISGGPASFYDRGGEWYDACSSHGSYRYPYGAAFDPTACNNPQKGTGSVLSVASLSTCQSPNAMYAGIFDMSGNVTEWTDACDGATETSLCLHRGGSWLSSSVRCDDWSGTLRSIVSEQIGFRCCSAEDL